MVYIHGGGFFGGSAGPGVTGPEYFMDSGEVILVTMAYRLGPFGEFKLVDYKSISQCHFNFLVWKIVSS